MKKRILSLALAIAMFVCLLPQTLFCASASSYKADIIGAHNGAYLSDYGNHTFAIENGEVKFCNFFTGSSSNLKIPASAILVAGDRFVAAKGTAISFYDLSDFSFLGSWTTAHTIDMFCILDNIVYYVSEGTVYCQESSRVETTQRIYQGDDAMHVYVYDSEHICIITEMANTSDRNGECTEETSDKSSILFSIGEEITFSGWASNPPLNTNKRGPSGSASNYSTVVGGTPLPLPEYPVGSYATENGAACSGHNRCLRYYTDPAGKTVDTYGWQCCGFARYAFYRCFGFVDWSGCGSFYKAVSNVGTGSITVNYLKNIFGKSVLPGAHIRTNTGTNGYQHSLVYLGCDDTYVYTYECNADGKCGVGNYKRTWAEMVSYLTTTKYGISYIDMPTNYPSLHSNHTYSGSYYEAAHPHKEYQRCSCGATKYTGVTKTVSTCETCNPVNTTTKYSAVLPFKAYLKGTSTVYPYTTEHLATASGGEIWSTDECTITAVYSNGACKVSYPTGSGTKTAYTSLSNFIGNTSASLTKQTINHKVTTYIRASTSSTQYGYTEPGDVIYKMGTSGNMTQIFYPTSSGYKLAWVLTSELKEPTYDTRFNPYCPIKGYICATSTINAYDSDYTTDIGDIWTTDFCYINAVYADGWCNVTYPVGSGTKTGYAKLSDFVYNASASHVKYTAKAQTTVYHTKNLAYIVSSDQPWYISAGDVFFVISTYGSASQVLYPIDAQYGGGYKLGWIATSALPKTTYTVSYNANGGTGAPASQTKTHGVALTLSNTAPIRTGYAFSGWATSSSATSATYAPGASYTTDASITLYAVWTLNKYEITYDANGGTNAPATQNKAHGTAITLSSSVPQKHFTVTFNANGGTTDVANRQVDCSFLGWSTSASAASASYQPGASFSTNANTTLYAVWKNNALAQYDFSVRNGYVFDGWYTAASGGTQVTSETVIAKNMTLYAHWSLATYTVCYDANGGTGAPAEQTKTHGQALTLSTTVPTRKNYTFLGWGTEENSTAVQYQPGGTYSSNSDIMLIAVWQFNLSPTIQVGSVSAKAGETVSIPVSLADNPGINTFTLGFDYDSTRLKLTGVTVNTALGGQFTYGTKAVWIGSADTEYVGEILTVTFEVLTTAAVGDAKVTVTYSDGDISNYSEENVDFAISAGKISVTQAHVHSYSYKVSATPTTSATGTLLGTCGCGTTTTVTLPKLNTTDYTYKVTKEATCTATGTGRYTWKTTTYGSFYFDVTIAKISHTYTSKVTAPTCTAQGYTTHTCSACGDSYKDSYTAALGHSYSYKATTAPTTSATGKLTGTCSRCNGTTTVTLPKLNTTDYTYKVTKEATCTATGTGRYTWKTTTYGSFYFDVTIAKISHTYTSKVTAPTCTAQGYTTYTCSVCGDSYKDNYAAAAGHKESDWITDREPECTELGSKHVECVNCGEILRTESIAAFGHDYKQTIVPPTCTEQGYTAYACARCEDSYAEDYTDALGHNESDWIVDRTATCTEEGSKHTECLTCGETLQTESVSAIGHDYESVTTDPTCINQGYVAHICTQCGDNYKDNYVEALGHEWDKGSVTTPPTATETGVKTYTCARCGANKTETIPATGGNKPCDGGANCPSANFRDVSVKDWFHESVDYAVANGLMKGTGTNKFEPENPMTRAMLVTVLWRYEGEPIEGTNIFKDVPDNEWYTKAVVWAAHNGIVGGVRSGRFDPDGKITREQLATILYRYCNTKGMDTSQRADLSSFPDGGKVSAYAGDAISWAVAVGLVTGSKAGNSTYLQPQGNATRAQVATILMRFIENVAK